MKRLILVVDDETTNRMIMGYILGEEYEVAYAENGALALDYIRENYSRISLVMLDFMMPVMDGFEVLRIMQKDENLARIPVIVLTSEASAEVESLRQGASDFLKKPYDMPEVILARVYRTIELSENRKIIRTTERDAMTGLYTRHFFYEYVRQLESNFPDTQWDAGALELDHFRLVQELYGWEFMETILKSVAEVLRTFLTGKDGEGKGLGCRHQGSLFLFCCPHGADYVVLQRSLKVKIAGISDVPWLTFRMGIYEKADQSIDAEQQFKRAEKALNGEREAYGETIAYFNERLLERSLYNERLLRDISTAMEKDQMEVYYQPRYSIQGDRRVLISAEARIRWIHPELGALKPNRFVPQLERTEYIQELDYFVIHRVAKLLGSLKKRGKDAQNNELKEGAAEYPVQMEDRDKRDADFDFFVAVKLSRMIFYDPQLEEKLVKMTRENGLSPGNIALEFSESVYAEDSVQILEMVKRLKNRGFLIELNDFYSGSSSLNMLSMLPFDTLRVDLRKFLYGFTEERMTCIVRATAEVGKYLDVKLAAEGVERESQLQILKEAGYTMAQGYCLGSPIPEAGFEELFLTSSLR
ncbi:MAG: EAL domain-containing protein [Lachnospiraceae bacterium]|nr:EAL domain-containing protein [Lachnospiraceae bacterium]